MLGKRSRLSIRKLAGVLRAGVMGSTTSLRCPLGFTVQSPTGPKSYDLGGIGLGIVAALDDKSNSGGRGEVLARHAICGKFSARLGPVRVDPWAEEDENGGKFRGQVMIEMKVEGLDEGSTHVTCPDSSKSMGTRVYHEGGEFGKTNENDVVSKISPVRSAGDRNFPGSDFLSSCHLCKKALHGKDIYMYGGEKAFCSTDCRQWQIGIDERKDRIKLEAVRSSDITNSPCSYTTTTTTTTTRGEIFFSTGVVAV